MEKASDEKMREQWESLRESLNERLRNDAVSTKSCDERIAIASCVASVCNLSLDELTSDSNKRYVTHARWLWWFAIRQVMNPTYDEIARINNSICKRKFTPAAIGVAMINITRLVDRELEWKNRWTAVKWFISIRDEDARKAMEKPKPKILIVIPSEMRNQVDIKYK